MCLGRHCRGHPVHVSEVGGCPHMCPWVGPHAPSFGRQLWGLPSRVEYLSPQGVLLPLVYGTTASPLWLELRGHSAWQATPSWTVYRLACHRLLPWLRVTFAIVPDAAWPGFDQWPWSTAPATGPVGRLGRPSASDPWAVGSFLSLGRPTCVQCPGPLSSCSPVCPRGLWCCVCGVLGHLAPAHRCARSVCCVACAVSWATWLLFTGAPARWVALRVRCPGPLGSCSPVCPLGVLCCVCGVLGHLAPVHRCARPVCCVACAVSWATWLLFTSAPARWVALRVRCPGPLRSCSPVCPLGVLCCVCGVLGLCFFLFFFGGGLRRFWCSAWVSVCAGAGAGVGLGAVGDGGRVAVALWVPCVCAGPQASGLQGAGPGVADGGWLAAVVAWRLRGWSRLLGSAWVAWPGAGVRLGVFMAWADGVVGSVGVAGLCGCRVRVRRRRGGLGWGTVGDAMGGGDAGDAYGGGAVGVETGWCC